jgi:hypothetical protein
MWPFDPNKQQMYQKYAQAYNTGNFSNVDPNEAKGQLSQFIQNAPPNEQQQIYQEFFAHMDPNQRTQLAQQMPQEYGINPNDPASMAQGFQRMGKERPDAMQRVLAHPIMVAGAVGLAGLVAKHMMDEHAQSQQH